MTFEEARAIKEELDIKNQIDSDNLKQFDKYRNSIGIVPDHIRETSEYKEANQAFKHSFSKLRNFNGWYVKTFKKEIQAERRNHYKKKVTTI